MADKSDKIHPLICGHVDSGKNTTTGRLIFEKPGDEAIFLPTQTGSNTCAGKAFNNINMPRSGDVMVCKKDFTVEMGAVMVQ